MSALIEAPLVEKTAVEKTAVERTAVEETADSQTGVRHVGVGEPTRPSPSRRRRPIREQSQKQSWGPRRVLLSLVLLAAVGLAGYQYWHGLNPSVWGANLHWGWASLAVVGALASQSGNVWNLTGASPVRLRFFRSLAAQFAGTLTRLISPSAVGAAAVNVQYLRRCGAGGVAAVGAVSVAQAVQVVSALVLLPPVAAFTSRDLELGLGFDTSLVWGAVVVTVALLAGTAWLIVARYPLLEARVRFAWREFTDSLRVMAQRPAKAVLSMLGAVVITAGLVLALWAAVHAFGGELSLALAACVLLVGTTAGNAVPVPGGIGTVEVALVAGLGAIGGVSAAAALPAVALFRLVTLWLQIPIGVGCVAWLRHRGAL